VTVPFDAETDEEQWRPALVAALRPAWRDSASVQFGLDPRRAVVVDGVGERSVRLLLGLDGARSQAEVLAAAAAERLDVAGVAGLLTDLRRAGVLTDAAAPLPRQAAAPAPADLWRQPAADVPWADGRSGGLGVALPEPGATARRRARAGRRHGRPLRVAGRLGPDRASLALLAAARRDHGGRAEDVLRTRQAAAVVVHGGGRVGATLAALLGAAGVGQVHVVDRGPVRPADLAPGGLVTGDLHRSRATAAADAIRRAAPEVQTGQLASHRMPDLVVIATARPVDTELAAALHGAGLPHLVVGVRETTAVVGPLVLPGWTTCLRCTDLYRADRDPAWPLLAAQLTSLRSEAAEPCDVLLATLAAALGGLQCLAHLDGEPAACRNGTLEFALPGWRLRRRSWPPHRRCGCGAAYRASGVGTARGEWTS
jgi:hypothetical protein